MSIPTPPPETSTVTEAIAEPAKTPNRILMLAAIVAGALIIGAVAGWGVTASAAGQAITSRDNSIVTLKDNVASLKSDLSSVQDQLTDAQDELTPQRELADREVKVKQGEDDLAAKQDAAAKREADVTARESAVQAREDAISAKPGDWWAGEVRECLARKGSYRMASVSAGGLGNNVSCMNG